MADRYRLRRELPRHTCPSIDEVLRKLRIASRELVAVTNMVDMPADAVDAINETLNDISDFDVLLEQLRSDNQDLRSVAESALDLLDEIEPRVEQLESDLEDSRGEAAQMEEARDELSVQIAALEAEVADLRESVDMAA